MYTNTKFMLSFLGIQEVTLHIKTYIHREFEVYSKISGPRIAVEVELCHLENSYESS